MKYIQGKDRKQTIIIPISMDAAIDKNHEIRILDLFVDNVGFMFTAYNFCIVLNFIGIEAFRSCLLAFFIQIRSVWEPLKPFYQKQNIKLKSLNLSFDSLISNVFATFNELFCPNLKLKGS